MSETTAFVYHEGFERRGFSPFPRVWARYGLTRRLIESLGLVGDAVRVCRPEAAGERELLLAHSKRYVDFVRRMSEIDAGYLDYGDAPAYRGVYERACLSVGGTIEGMRLILNGEAARAFNPAGGMHHAKRDSAGGFNVFNDIAIAARYAQKRAGINRIAIIDIDGHHCNGTQELLYGEPLLKVSLHRHGGGFYPGTGSLDEVGEGAGEGCMVNIPLPRGTGDEAYLYAFREIVVPLLVNYGPELILLQFGVDAHHQDPLVGLSLTTRAYEQVASVMRELADRLCEGRLMIPGGGGYVPENVARCWAIMLATVSGHRIRSEARYQELHDMEEPERGGEVFERVKGVVEEVKRRVFPYHGLSVA